MFIVNLQYTAPLEQLDAHMSDHVKFLQKYYKQNTFLASGRKVPRTGGIILAMGESKEAIEKIMHEDPFCKNNVAESTVTEFLTSQMHPEFRKMIGELTR
jgi:uncharacterized protein YciI